MRLSAVALDRPDPLALTAFCERAAGFEPHPGSDGDSAGLLIALQRVDAHRAPGWPDEGAPQQLHPDSTVDDLDQAESRLLELGASKPDHQPDEAERSVLTDPARHPFCPVRG